MPADNRQTTYYISSTTVTGGKVEPKDWPKNEPGKLDFSRPESYNALFSLVFR